MQSVAQNSLNLDTSGGSQFLTFSLYHEEFGIEILRVQEIKGLSRITSIPNMPKHVQGVINLRGTVVPIVDLRLRFNLPEAEYNQFTVIIVVTIGERTVGLVVDSVSDVLDVPTEDIEAAPQLGGDVDCSFLKGIAKSRDRLITLLDMDEIICAEEVALQTAG